MYKKKKQMIKNTKTLKIKYKYLFVDKHNAISNIIRFFLLFIFFILFKLITLNFFN